MKNIFYGKTCLPFPEHDIVDLLHNFLEMRVHMQRIVSTDKEPNLTEILELMLENETDTCVVKAFSPLGMITVEINILDFMLKEDIQC